MMSKDLMNLHERLAFRNGWALLWLTTTANVVNPTVLVGMPL